MARKTDEKRADLRARLIDIAEDVIAREGASNLKARPLAAEAGCAVGAIYNVFGDMNELIMAVNGRTFARLGRDVGEKGQDPDLAPVDALIALANAYLQFAIDNPRAWRALFSVRLETKEDVPAWYKDELKRLLFYIARPLKRAFPDMDDESLELMARTLFSSTHGIVSLGVENRIPGVTQDRLQAMLSLLLQQVTK